MFQQKHPFDNCLWMDIRLWVSVIAPQFNTAMRRCIEKVKCSFILPQSPLPQISTVQERWGGGERERERQPYVGYPVEERASKVGTWPPSISECYPRSLFLMHCTWESKGISWTSLLGVTTNKERREFSPISTGISTAGPQTASSITQ